MSDTNTQRQKAEDNAQQYVYARDAGHLDYVRKANQCLNFVDSYGDKQWDEQIAKRLRAQGKPVLTIGKILPTMAILMGEQINNQLDVSFRATASGDENTAATMDKVWLHVIHNNAYQYVKGDVFDSGAITSRGYMDVRMTFDDNIRGDVKITDLNPKNVVLDPDASKYDPDEWSQVFTSFWKLPESIGRDYGDAAERELNSRPQSAFAYGGQDFIDFPVDGFGRTMGYQNLVTGPDGAKLRRFVRMIERQHVEYRRVPHFVDPETGETRPIPTNWDEEKIRRVVQTTGVLVATLRGRTLRWTVSADDLLLHDETSPYEHFTQVPYFPYLIRGRTIGMVENLIGSQEGLNKARSQELHIISSIANSGWKLRAGALQNMTITELEERGADTGLVLELTNPGDAEKITPNQVPTGIDRVTYKFDEDLQQLPNVGPGMRSTAREDVSGKALQQQEVRGTIGQARPLANLTRTDELVAKRVVSLVQRFYTDERMLNVVRQDAHRTGEVLTVNQVQPDGTILNDLTVGEYDIITTPVPAREQHEDTVFDQVVTMREKLGIAIPDAVIVSNSRLPNKGEIMQAIEPDETARRMAEIELETAEAELEKLRTENMDRRASAVDKVARASRTTAETGQDAGGQGGSEAAELGKLEIEREKMEREMQLKERVADEKLRMEREQMRRQARIEERKLAQEQQRINNQAEVQQEQVDIQRKKAEADARKPKPKPKAA